MSAGISLVRFVSVVGIVLLVMSFLFPAGADVSVHIAPDTYEGESFFATEDMYLWIESGDTVSRFSLYIFNSTITNQILESGSLEGIEPIFSLENITEYQGVAHFPHSGIYGYFLTHSYNNTRFIRGVMSAQPRMVFIYLGLILISPMAVIFISRLFRKKGRILDRLLDK